MAPQVAADVRRYQEQGRLHVRAEPTPPVTSAAGGWVLASSGVRLAPAAAVLCTGPSADITASAPGCALVAAGRARRGPFGIGYDVDQDGSLVDAAGRPDRRLVAIGPLRRGVLGESTAVPEISVQAAALAQRLAGGSGPGDSPVRA
jgi:uncharacterized NAD(P)/FAD-binding protein YdhS